MTQNLAQILSDRLLSRVEQPSRYLGGELNAVGPASKDLAQVRVRLALVFPDLYDLGLGNLGIHILYHLLNRKPWVWAERVYSPAPDMEALLRAQGLPVFALESKDALSAFDGIGFTLQSELTFTNILNILDMSGIPLRSRDRRAQDPLIFGGGPSVFNPEPLAPFMDFFVIGDGEDVILEIAEVLDAVADRQGRLRALAGLEGVYVPALHATETLPDGRVFADPSTRVRRRLVQRLDPEAFPTDYIVPFTRQVHDRVSLEVLRGCTHGCRFCQAGMTNRPVRERTVDEIADLYDRTMKKTGYEEVSLVSLSTCDHSHVRQMVDRVAQLAAPDRVSVSLPSLRLDSFSVELADTVAGIRRTGLTFAPEAASPRLRALINKWIPDEDLLQMADRAYGLGWDHVKLYFMIGLPTERDDDVEAIADLTLRTLEVGRRVNRRAKVNTGVSTFVPKPFTPLQWARQISMEETRQKQELLYQRFGRNRAVRFGRHSPEETFLEGLLSRADRRAADLIELAWRKGARFDAWDEHRRFDLWREAVIELGLDPSHELRERQVGERLPWDHIDNLVDDDWLVADWNRAMVLEHAEDCRHSKCHRCGVIDQERALCAHMLRSSIEGRKAPYQPQAAPARPPRPGEAPQRTPAPPPVQRLVFRIGITGDLRHLAHLEAMNAWQRALRRVQAPLAYSEGFHPHPKMAFSSARPLGEETLGDYMDITLSRRVDPEDLRSRLAASLAPGIHVYTVREVPLQAPSLMSQVRGAAYVFGVTDPPSDLAERVDALMAADTIPWQRKRKRRLITMDMRPHVETIERVDVSEGWEGPAAQVPGEAHLHIRLRTIEGRGARPSELIALLELEPQQVRVLRLDTLLG